MPSAHKHQHAVSISSSPSQALSLSSETPLCGRLCLCGGAACQRTGCTHRRAAESISSSSSLSLATSLSSAESISSMSAFLWQRRRIWRTVCCGGLGSWRIGAGNRRWPKSSRAASVVGSPLRGRVPVHGSGDVSRARTEGRHVGGGKGSGRTLDGVHCCLPVQPVLHLGSG